MFIAGTSPVSVVRRGHRQMLRTVLVCTADTGRAMHQRARSPMIEFSVRSVAAASIQWQSGAIFVHGVRTPRRRRALLLPHQSSLRTVVSRCSPAAKNGLSKQWNDLPTIRQGRFLLFAWSAARSNDQLAKFTTKLTHLKHGDGHLEVSATGDAESERIVTVLARRWAIPRRHGQHWNIALFNHEFGHGHDRMM